jgi:DNA-binding transcriptional LysR family regulator
LSAGLERVREIATGDAGRLSVGFTPTTALRFLPLLVSSFRQEFAGVDLGLVELHPDAMRDGLLAREIDVSLIREPTAVPGLEIVPIVEEPFVAVLPVGHKMADPSTPFSLAGLRHDPFVLFPRDEASGGLAKMLALCAEAGFTPRIVQEAPGWQTAISLVGSGLGVSILPESVVSLQLPGITYRLIASVIRSQTCLLCREDDRRPMVRNFIACGAAVMVG